MSHNTARKIAKIIAVLTAIAMIVTSFSFMLFAAAPTVVYAETSGSSAAQEAYVDAELEFMKELMEDIRYNYKDEITYEQMVDGAFKGIFDSLDPHSVYYSTNEEKEDFVNSVDGRFSGIGVSLDSSSGQCVVIAPIAGTPADRAGILPGDIVVDIDGTDVTSFQSDKIVSMLRGEAGTEVTVGVRRSGHSGIIKFVLVREVIVLSSVSGKMLEDGIGYIKIDSFDSDTDREFTAEKLKLIKQGMKRLVIDLRNNPGGYIGVAADIANQLMPAGPIVHFEQQGDIKDSIEASGAGITYLSVAVLINEGSASSSEILAGALQDSGAAVLVGTQSYGKGTAQRVVSLKNGASMKLSEYYFLTPDKNVIDKIGLTPDYVVENATGGDEELKAMIEETENFAPMPEPDKPKAGDMGLNVFGAQQRLEFLGYEVQVTGTMDTGTVSAVRLFQKGSGLYAYGVLDVTTRGALVKAVAERIGDAARSDADLQLEKAIEVVKLN